jgi:SagB-type dehydrogenase family enzyme
VSRDPVSAAVAYHELSKHRLPNRYARSRGYLDWDTQPNPFRLYDGVDRVALARPDSCEGPSFDQLYDPTRVPAAPLEAASVARLLFDSLALSAWKQHGSSRWSLRCNPSSGNLHPTEAHLITSPLAGLSEAPTVWHYTSLLHALERRAALEPAIWSELIGDGDGLLVGLSSIAWREAWKYGERAYRYCQHDVGHAIAALAYAAAALGWHTRMLPRFDDAAVAALLGLEAPEGPEAEHPDLLLFIGPRLPSRAIDAPRKLETLTFEGTPNQLSESHHLWPVVDQVARACVRVGPVALPEPMLPAWPEPPPTGASARQLFRTRRSAVEMDGVTTLSRAAWLRMLARTLARPGQVPFASLLGRPRVHLLLFVHRVDDIEPGLYLLLRDPAAREAIASSIHADFRWTPIATDELDLPLYLLEHADTRNAAALVSCRQAIAADGAFAVAMLAELEPTLREHGAWMYRHLHWEAGAIGQVLYLEAEAAARRATGIGCFFDDAVHELLGLRDRSLATLYHFTVGGPLDDARLRTVDAYHHLDTHGRRPD